MPVPNQPADRPKGSNPVPSPKSAKPEPDRQAPVRFSDWASI